MKTTQILQLVSLLGAVLFAHDAAAQSSTLTYQGRLADSGTAVNTPHDFRFRLYDAGAGGNQVGSQLAWPNTTVEGGVFTVELDFGAAAFTGANRWLEVEVSPAGANTWTIITPRHFLASAPYAMRATKAGTADTATSATTATTATSVVAGGVNNAALQNGAVDSAKIADGTIATSDLNPALLNSTFWRLLGNAGTTPGTHFLGTTDNQPLAFRANNAEAMRLSPGANGPALRLTGPGGSSALTAIELATYNPGASAPAATLRAHDNNWSADLVFSTKKPGHTTNALESRLTIKNDGRVGIGASFPNASLDVWGGIRAWGGMPGANGSANSGYAFGFGGDNDSGMFSSGDGQVEFYSNNNERMRLHSNGHIGIGTPNPGGLLSLRGGALAFHAPFNDVPYVGLDYDDAGDALRVRANLYDVQLNTDLITIKRDGGNVGIGASNPQAKLEIQAGADSGGGYDLHAIALAYRTGGFRHWIRSRHNGAVSDNGIDFYVNTSGTAAASSAPGVGNKRVLVLDSITGVNAVGGLVIENRTNDPSGPVNGQIWLLTN